jgi:hypothetical protein
MQFNKKKCLALLKEKNKLAQEGNWNYDKVRNKELVGYLTLLEDQIFWQSRKEYFQILDLFVSKNITFDEFFDQFSGLRCSNREVSQMQKKNLEAEAFGIFTKSNEIDFQLNPESRGFSKIIYSLYYWLDVYNPDITLDMNLENPELIWYGMSEEYLRLSIKDNFLPEIGKYSKEF